MTPSDDRQGQARKKAKRIIKDLMEAHRFSAEVDRKILRAFHIHEFWNLSPLKLKALKDAANKANDMLSRAQVAAHRFLEDKHD